MNKNQLQPILVSLSALLFVSIFTIFGQSFIENFQIEAQGQTKGYVCKYVSNPGSSETLQTGQNPIEVAASSISGWDGTTIPFKFNDKQGNSIVIGIVPMDPEPDINDCPAPSTCVEDVTCPDECRDETVTIAGSCGSIECVANPPAEEFCPDGCTTETTYVSDGTCEGNKTCEANAPIAGECPTECGYEGGDEVSDGKCGYISCEPTEKCVDSSPSPSPESSPEPSPSVSPSPNPSEEPTPTPTPSPSPAIGGVGGKSVLGVNISCDPNFEVTLDITDNNNPVKDVKVDFKYDSSTHEAKTNGDGRASTYFSKTKNGSVEAIVDGYPDQSIYVTLPECQEGEVLGATTEPETHSTTTYFGAGGQVLGATTLADTGNADEMLPILILVLGSLMTVVSGYAYRKTK